MRLRPRFHRPTAEELLKHPFFSKAKGKEYIVQHLVSLLPPLTQRATAKTGSKSRKPGASGKLKKVQGEDGEVAWEWESDDDENAGGAGAGAGPGSQPVQAAAEPGAAVDELNFKLRYGGRSISMRALCMRVVVVAGIICRPMVA